VQLETITVTNNFDIFRKEYLEANTWTQRKDGVPLGLLDNLSIEELKLAELELIKAASLRDDWSIVGLGHIKSKNSLPTLISLLADSNGPLKVKIAHSIFQISQDEKMKDIVLATMPKITGEFELIDVLYYLPFFNDKRITDLLHSYINHKNYLVAYNATRYLGLPTDEVVERFRNK
jgi:HEAT repeat protein